MTLRIYNTLTRNKDKLIPGGTECDSISDYPPVTIYSCGPTVYSYAHIGNFRTFLFNDFLRRYLKFVGYKINHTMNITDVDDKTIAGAQKENISLKEYTERYASIFFDDLKKLNVEPVENTPRATDSIDAMIDILNKLNEKGILYEKDGSLYFSIAKFEPYGKLSRLDTREIKSGLRYDTDEYEKDDVRDFALWKTTEGNEISWETPFGKGRPGWHIECSAMIRKIYGSTIDIHTGGVDLIFPHHENEIAQSEAAYDEPFVRHWIHIEHLLVDGAKMSKSLGNLYTIQDLLDKGFTPRSIRYLLISAHYRKQLNFTFEGLKQAEQALSRIDNFVLRLQHINKSIADNPEIEALSQTMIDSFIAAVNDDLNISGGLGVFFEFINTINSLINDDKVSVKNAETIMATLQSIDSVFAFIFDVETSDDVDAQRIEDLITERNQARADKNFQRADEIRDQLLNEGIVLEDAKDGTRWKKKK